LIRNALKFTEKGHIPIAVRCLKQTPTAAQLEIAIEDTGIGIPKDKLETVFERFEQVRPAYVRPESQNGTGLGLSITKRLIDLMNGTVRVESILGKGTIFHCTIEFPLQDEAIAEQPWAAYAAKIRVLVIDDTLRAEVICKHISSSQCDTTAGAKAVHTLFTAQQLGQPYDVVIIDEQLKTVDVSTLIKEIQRQKSLHQPMAILLVPQASLQDKKNAKDAGFFDVVVKPVQPIAFQTALTSAWERWVESQEHKVINKVNSTIKALLVEDDKIVQLVHKKMLTALNCQVEIADNGTTALRMVTKNSYQIVFIDIGLPDISGFEVIKNLRSNESINQRIPIIALTGYTTEEEKQACLVAGANEVAIKPANADTLREIITRYHH